jgi:hypothetical protein
MRRLCASSTGTGSWNEWPESSKVSRFPVAGQFPKKAEYFFRVRDHPGAIAKWAESKCCERPLLREDSRCDRYGDEPGRNTL